MPKKIEISHRTIVFTVLLLLGLWVLYLIRGIVLQLFVAFLLATILDPLVSLLRKIKIPRAVAILITYILVIGILGGVIALFAPAMVTQTTNFVNALPGYLTNIGIDSSTSGNLVNGILNQFGSVSGEILNFTLSIFSNFLSMVTVLVFTFYMLLLEGGIKGQVKLLFGEERGLKISGTIAAIEEKLGKWARGEMILMLAVGTGVYLGLLAIGIPYALPLAGFVRNI
jgi:predicted PurR-regulated permease PerM